MTIPVSFDHDGKPIAALSGRIDSGNASEAEQILLEICKEDPSDTLTLDCDELEYISSAGLRILLRLKRSKSVLRMINVHAEIYDVLEMTGFTEILTIQKAYRVLSVESCEVVGKGSNGMVYRYDRETIIKVYRESDALSKIEQEREYARTAFIAGIPTAIPYDVVRIENGGYGTVFELLNAESLAEMLIAEEKSLTETAEMSIDLLHLIHANEARPGTLPDMRKTVLGWIAFLENELPKPQYEKLLTLCKAVPESLHILHGDYHIKNIMFQNGECLLVDMDTISCGHPVFELASMYNAYRGYGETDHSAVEKYLGISWEMASAFWKKSLELYLGTEDEETIRSVENKARIIGTVRMLRRSIRRNGLNTEKGRAEIEYNKEILSELLEKVDSLLF